MRPAVALVLSLLGLAHGHAAGVAGLRVSNGSTPFAGDTRRLTTVRPNGDGFRDAAHLRFTLEARAHVELDVLRRDSVSVDPEQPSSKVVQHLVSRDLPAGPAELAWKPSPSTAPRTYTLALTVGGARAFLATVRVQGIDAGFPLAANNLFWRVIVQQNGMRKAGLWRDQGNPEAALVGAQYVGSNHGQVQAPFVVTGAGAAPWLFAGTGLADGSTFGRYGIEIDASGPGSPPGTLVPARIPDLLGPGKSAEMTYYETAAGAKVFDAGALNFAASATTQPVSQLLLNLWARLSRP